MAAIIETQELTKNYGDLVAVNRLSLQVEEGEIFGFLGPNGAGKTTTILMLLGLTEPTSGKARVCGHNPTREPLKVKRLVGYLPENVGFYEDLSAYDNLMYTAQLNGLRVGQARARIEQALAMVELSQVKDKRVEQFSRGMKQRLGIADVLIKSPHLAVLDEPTLGIDPDGSNRILDMIVDMNQKEGVTVVLSSHLLHQVQRICHRVGIMSRGKMVVTGSVDQLGSQLRAEGGLTLEVQASPLPPALLEAIQKMEGVQRVERSGELLHIACQQDIRHLVAGAVNRAGSTLLHLRLQDYTLEEIYLRYFREG